MSKCYLCDGPEVVERGEHGQWYCRDHSRGDPPVRLVTRTAQEQRVWLARKHAFMKRWKPLTPIAQGVAVTTPASSLAIPEDEAPRLMPVREPYTARMCFVCHQMRVAPVPSATFTSCTGTGWCPHLIDMGIAKREEEW